MGEDRRAEMRPDLYVVARFLEKLKVEGGSKRKTELQMAVGLNYNVYSRYLEWLERKGLIVMREEEEKYKVIAMTKKGFDTYETLVKWIMEVVGPEKRR